MIPNNIHFIFFGFTEFTMIHYLAVKTALSVHKPDKVIIHNTIEPEDNELWNSLLPFVEIRNIVPPSTINGVALTSYQYKADIARLEILIKEGGIYFDIDVLSVNPITTLLNNTCVLGIEAADDAYTTDINKAKSITNAVIMSEPNHPFIMDWLKNTSDNIVGKSWAYHAVCLPLELLKQNKYNVHVEPRWSFMPFDFRDDSVFGKDSPVYDRLKNAYTMHFWETIWFESHLRKIDKDYLNTVDNNFSKLFKELGD